MKRQKEIDPTQAREKVQRGDARLVCAYDDEDKCRRLLLDGAISLGELKRAKPSKDEELIFYCA